MWFACFTLDGVLPNKHERKSKSSRQRMTLGASRSRAMTSAVHSITSKASSVVKPR
jgi:hypothetical protein